MSVLTGLRVVDLTRVLAGPLVTMMLGDMGADVIKIEEPKSGDLYRNTGSIYINGESTSFLSVNRNKRSITLDLGSEAGGEVFRTLVQGADVLVENFRPGVTERLGIDYPSLHDLNPRLVYCSVSGFGSSGPYRNRTAVDPIIQAESGVMSLTGELGGDPVRVGTAVGDIYGAMLATQGVLLALLARTQSGVGQLVEVSLLDAALFGLIPREGEYFATGDVFPPMGTTHPQIVPFRAFRTADDPIFIAAFHDGLWRKLCDGIDRADLAADPRLIEGIGRVTHRAEVDQEIETTLQSRSAVEWLGILDRQGVPAARINDLDQALNSPQAVHNRMVVDMQHPVAGPIRVMNNPIRLSEAPATIRMPPPTLGQHTTEILSEIGIDSEGIRQLTDGGVV
jgi:crotonobetainyl-CoA:carnitine CoA-transferase CaiB-like acyl-CoA transferase